MQRHHDRVVDLEVLRQRDIEPFSNRAGAQMTRETRMDRHPIIRHRRLVVGAGGLVGNADGEDWEIIEKERVEMIVGVDHQHVGLGGVQLPGDVGIEPCGLALGTGLCHLGGKHRCVRNAEGGDDLGHDATFPARVKRQCLRLRPKAIPDKRPMATSLLPSRNRSSQLERLC